MFGRKDKEEAEETTGRYRSETVQSTMATAQRHGRAVEKALNAGAAQGWTLVHATSASAVATQMFTILFWDTEAGA